MQRVGYGYIQSRVEPASPVWEENIRWSPVVAGKKGATLLEWRKARSGCRIMEGIPNGIVPHYALTTRAADHAVVTQDVTVLSTAGAGSWLVIDWKTQPELAGNNKLSAAEVETKSRKGGAVEP